MDPLTTVLLAILAAVGGGALKAVLDWVRGRQQDAVNVAATAQDLTAQFYATWEAEIKRLATQVDRLNAQINRLNILVGALENEIHVLGGDPQRIRAQVDEQLRMAVEAVDSSDT